MLQVSALASTCFTGLVFKNLTEWFMRAVLDVLIQDLQLPIAGQCLVDQARKHRIVEKRFYPELRSVLRAGQSIEACRQAWSRHRLTERGNCTGRRNQQQAASERSCFFFRPKWLVDFSGCAGKAPKFPREGAKNSVEIPANG